MEGALDPAGKSFPSAAQLALLVESVSDYAIFMLDPDGRIASWNEGARRLKGYSADEIIGQHFSRFYTEPDRLREHPQEELEIATLEGRFEEEGWRVRKDGSQFWANVVITALREQSGRLVGFGKVTRDLTARRLQEEQMRSTAAELQRANDDLRQFRLLVTSVEDYAIFTVDPAGHVATWNLGAEKLKGYTAEEAVGMHFSDFYTPEDRLQSKPAHALERTRRDGHYESEGWRVRKDGTRFWANATLAVARDEAGRPVGYVKITRDLTERKRAHDQLLATQQELMRSNADLQHLAASAAHDLRDPLQTLAGFATLLKSRHADSLDAQALGFIETMLSSADHMNRLLSEMSDYAAAGEGESAEEPVDATEAAQGAIRNLQALIAEHAARVEVRLPGDARVLCPALDLLRVFQNLISNAVKFGGDGRVVVGGVRTGPGWRFEVIDNGPGIDEADRERIFQPFRRVGSGEHAGSGMGLAICHKTVTKCGGTLGVERGPGGRGSRFWFTLPAG